MPWHYIYHRPLQPVVRRNGGTESCLTSGWSGPLKNAAAQPQSVGLTTRGTVSLELDHVFILCAVDAPEASALARLGLHEGPANTHPGQGTACRRFVFRNAYIELLWVRDEWEARSESVFRTRLWERWSLRGRRACPFGIVLRPAGSAGTERPPFPTWPYAPSYLPAGLAIDVAVDTPLHEPEFFYLGFQQGRAPGLQAVTDGIAAPAITDVSIGMPAPGPESVAARSAETSGVLSFNVSSEYVLGLTFDRAIEGRTADLRPDLPLMVHW